MSMEELLQLGQAAVAVGGENGGLDVLSMACDGAGAGAGEGWSDLLAAHMRTLARMPPSAHEGAESSDLIEDGDGEAWAAAYNEYTGAYNAFLGIFKTSEGKWLLPVMRRVVVNLRLIARRADTARLRDRSLQTQQQQNQNQQETVLEVAEREIKRCFPLTVSDRAQLAQSKKWGTITLMNNLYKIYFQLNNLRLCRNLLPYVTQTGFPAIERFPIGQQVPYRYFQGRLAIYSANYPQARDDLRFTFAHCPAWSARNKRLILTYLIPCELLVGRAPSARLLAKYGLVDQFGALVRAIRTGSLRLFDEGLARQQEFFVQKGIYLILERLRYITYRNLFRKVFLVTASPKLKVALFQAAIAWQGVPMEPDEVECILANLIAQGFIKGYLSHQAATLVVHKDPRVAFPALSTIKSLA